MLIENISYFEKRGRNLKIKYGKGNNEIRSDFIV